MDDSVDVSVAVDRVFLGRRNIEEAAEKEGARGDGDDDGQGTDQSEKTHGNLASSE